MFVTLLALAVSERSFRINGDDYEMDGKVFRYVSGSFHYFRQQPDMWEETIKKMANGGLNAVCTYVAWNLHEPEQGKFNFEGIADIERFVSIAAKYNMYVILRPGPFICAEWDFGGFPWWLTQIDGIQVRSSDEKFLKPVDAWFTELFGRLKKHMYHNGGNIILVQVENEYGSYPTCDQVYLKHLCDLTKQLLGDETVLFTTDGSGEGYLKCGSIIKEAYATVDFGCGYDSKTPLELGRRWNNGHGPYVNSEFYPGWLDHWGENHAKTDTGYVCSTLEDMLKLNANVNIYMYFGGTNFKYYNGANGGGNSYDADPTEYDYDAPLNEMADMTYKWEKVRDTIKKYATWEIPTYDVKNTTKKSYGEVKFTEGAKLWDVLPTLAKSVKSQYIKPMEDLGGDFGYTLYHTTLQVGGQLYIKNIRDRVSIYVDKKLIEIVRRGKEKNVKVPAGELDLLVECMGRLNFGGSFFEKHGLITNVTLDGKIVENWEMTTFNLDNIKDAKLTSELPVNAPAIYKGTFNVDGVADTFLNPTGWKKGNAFINGYNIGRYWYPMKPQLTLYIPRNLIHEGTNEIIIFECDPVEEINTMKFDDTQNVDFKP